MCLQWPPADEEAALVTTTLPGGYRFQFYKDRPTDLTRFPPCYGSVMVLYGLFDYLGADALLSDFLSIGGQVRHSVFLAGRVSGVVNLGSTQMKDGYVMLGIAGSPITWCENSQFLIDGLRAAALQADRQSFQYETCLADRPGPKGKVRMSMRGARIDEIIGMPILKVADNPVDQALDNGLLGLSADELKAIALPPAALRAPATYEERDKTRAAFDPQTLALLSSKLKDAGYVGKANALSMERVSRQKWNSDDPMDRLKWILGWPVGWGYQTELGFVYALFFVIIGAWVSAYYRDFPEDSPPGSVWLKSLLTTGTAGEERDRLKRAGLRGAEILVAILLPVLALVFLPEKLLWLTPQQAIGVLGVLILIQIIVHLRLVGFLRYGDWRQQVLRFAASGRHVGWHNIFFSLDRFLPSPGFHSYWGNYPRIGQTGRNYFYLHRLIGLFIISITAAGAAGLFE